MGHGALVTAAEWGFSCLSLPFPLCLFPSFRAACNISWILVRWFVLMLVHDRGEFALAFRKCMCVWGGTQQQCACAWIGVPVLSVRSRCALPVFPQPSWVWHSCSEQHRAPHHSPSLGQGSSLYCSGLWNLMPRDGTCKNMVAHMSCGAVPCRRAGPAGRAAPTMHSVSLFSLNPAGLSGIFFLFLSHVLWVPTLEF